MKKHCFKRNLSLFTSLDFFPDPNSKPFAEVDLAEVVAASPFSRYLPLVVKQPSPPSPATRLVVFEGFYNPT